MAGEPVVFTNGERETWKPAHVDLVGSLPGGHPARVAVGKFYVSKLRIPVRPTFINSNNQRMVSL